MRRPLLMTYEFLLATDLKSSKETYKTFIA